MVSPIRVNDYYFFKVHQSELLSLPLGCFDHKGCLKDKNIVPLSLVPHITKRPILVDYHTS